MSKNAFVLHDHYGDDGSVTEGMILRDVTSKRFEELEKGGLVREATAEEVEAGFAPSIEPDPSKADEGADEDGAKAAKSPSNKKAADPANKGA